jgi:hypothetical protein
MHTKVIFLTSRDCDLLLNVINKLGGIRPDWNKACYHLNKIIREQIE